MEKEEDKGSIEGFTTKSLIYYVVAFLAIYLVSYFLLSLFFKNSDENTLRLVRMMDIFVFVFVVIVLFIIYGNKTTDEVGSQLSKQLEDLKKFSDNDYAALIVFVFILVFYSSIYVVRIPMSSQLKPFSITMIENIAFIFLAILLILTAFRNLLNIDLLNDAMFNVIKEIRPLEVSVPTSQSGNAPEKPKEPVDEVFNIRNNVYTYDDAAAVCSIYGAKLATYDQVEKAYTDGGEWCNYGWSQDQMALFPTQKATWTELQKYGNAKNSCGRPGINGGYIKNKNAKFGVNCYGKKPKPSREEKAWMKANSNIQVNVPVSPADKMLQTKLDIWKNNASQFLVLNSFNRNEWSDNNP
jgi:hypothetical protein